MSRKIGQAPKLKRYTLTYLRLLKKLSKKKGLIIDNKAFEEYIYGKRPLIKVIKRSNIMISTEFENLDTGISRIMEVIAKYPRLNSRTDRAKVAIAVIAMSLSTNNYDKIRGLHKKLGISRVHLRRLVNLVKREKSFIKEVQTVISRN